MQRNVYAINVFNAFHIENAQVKMQRYVQPINALNAQKIKIVALIKANHVKLGSAEPNLAVKNKIVELDINVNRKNAHWTSHQGIINANQIKNAQVKINLVLKINARTRA